MDINIKKLVSKEKEVDNFISIMSIEEALKQLEWYFERDDGLYADLTTRHAFKILKQEFCKDIINKTDLHKYKEPMMDIVSTKKLENGGKNMTLDEAIRHAEEVAEFYQNVVDTEMQGNIPVSALYCDDTEMIETHLKQCQKDANEYRQFAEWLKEYQRMFGVVEDIKKQINSPNRNTCDYFIVDQIENIIIEYENGKR